MSQTTQLGSTVVFPNRFKRNGDKRPDFSGEELTINCPHCQQAIEAALAIWQRQTRKGAPMLSVTINTRYKKPEQPQDSQPQPEQENAPQANVEAPAAINPDNQNGAADAQTPPSEGDDIPF